MVAAMWLACSRERSNAGQGSCSECTSKQEQSSERTTAPEVRCQTAGRAVPRGTEQQEGQSRAEWVDRSCSGEGPGRRGWSRQSVSSDIGTSKLRKQQLRVTLEVSQPSAGLLK